MERERKLWDGLPHLLAREQHFKRCRRCKVVLIFPQEKVRGICHLCYVQTAKLGYY